MMQFESLTQDLEDKKKTLCDKSLTYDSLCYILPFWLVTAVNTAEEEEHLVTQWINQSQQCLYNSPPVFAHVC